MDKIITKEAIQHLRKDPILRKAIDQIELPPRNIHANVYDALISSIIGQQLSVKAASTIKGRFLDLFDGNFPLPQELMPTEDEWLRKVGLSRNKASYVKNVAQFFDENDLLEKDWSNDTDEDIINLLTQIKGVGRWTVEMILMFALQRPDVFPLLDLGIQNGIKKLYDVTAEKKELYKAMEEISQPWKPHRTLACLYLWGTNVLFTEK